MLCLSFLRLVTNTLPFSLYLTHTEKAACLIICHYKCCQRGHAHVPVASNTSSLILKKTKFEDQRGICFIKREEKCNNNINPMEVGLIHGL